LRDDGSCYCAREQRICVIRTISTAGLQLYRFLGALIMSLSSLSTPSTSSQPRRSPLLIAKERTLSEFDQIPIMCGALRHFLPPSPLTRPRAPSEFTHARSPDPAVRRALADEIRDASINVGFFYLSHHGIPPRAVRGAVAAAQAFFALPAAEKLAVRPFRRRWLRARSC
jgi:hypothetical protein